MLPDFPRPQMHTHRRPQCCGIVPEESKQRATAHFYPLSTRKNSQRHGRNDAQPTTRKSHNGEVGKKGRNAIRIVEQLVACLGSSTVSEWQSSAAAERHRHEACNKASHASIRECGALVTSRFSGPKLSNTGRKNPDSYFCWEGDDPHPVQCDHLCTVSAPHSLTGVITGTRITILVSYRAGEGCATFSSTRHFRAPTVTLEAAFVARRCSLGVCEATQERKPFVMASCEAAVESNVQRDSGLTKNCCTMNRGRVCHRAPTRTLNKQ